MRSLAVIMGLCVLAVISVSCGKQPASNTEPSAAAKPAAPSVPPGIEQAAESALGTEAEVLAWGDLALDGQEQALIVNRLKTTPKGAVPGVLLTRAIVIENDGKGWRELFRCDEHLKNGKGYLAATPLASVSGWRLQYEQDKEKGLLMYFTPLEQPAGGYIQTIGVRWNPKVKRYQSLDRSFQEFLGETPALETPERRLRG